DVFDMDYTAIADILGRSEVACRQLAARGRDHVRQDQPRFPASADTRDRLVTAFMAAAARGDVDTLAQLLADDAVMYSDGGGKRPAAPVPLRGRAEICAFLGRLANEPHFRASVAPEVLERVELNGLPGFIVHEPGGITTIAFEIAGDRITAMYAIRNPDKLRHLS